MLRVWRGLFGAALLAVAMGCSLDVAEAQQIQFDLPQHGAERAQKVSLDTDAFTVQAGKPDWIELRFHIAPGLHINSHTPHDETLIPTALKLDSMPVLKVSGDEYPSGIPFHLSTGAGETLSTYQGDFRVRVKVTAPRGESLLTGSLHYQACDAASCFPPRDLPLRLVVSAR